MLYGEGSRVKRSVARASLAAQSAAQSQLPSDEDTDGSARPAESVPRQVVAVPLLSLLPADSPRLNGEDRAHILRLAETETPLPPILVDKRTMRVIDGMHRLMAAS